MGLATVKTQILAPSCAPRIKPSGVVENADDRESTRPKMMPALTIMPSQLTGSSAFAISVASWIKVVIRTLLQPVFSSPDDLSQCNKCNPKMPRRVGRL